MENETMYLHAAKNKIKKRKNEKIKNKWEKNHLWEHDDAYDILYRFYLSVLFLWACSTAHQAIIYITISSKKK